MLGLRKRAGRNNEGRVTVRHRGGGHKRLYRLIDFKRDKIGVPGRVASIEYDPNRSARIALVVYADGEKRYILAPLDLKVGAQLMSGPEAEVRVGNALPMRNIPLGTVIHNSSCSPGRGGQMARSAGVGAQVMAKEGDYAQRAPAQWRGAPGRDGLHGDDWPGRQHRPRQHQPGQGRPQALAGLAPDRAWCGDGPELPSAWWW